MFSNILAMSKVVAAIIVLVITVDTVIYADSPMFDEIYEDIPCQGIGEPSHIQMVLVDDSVVITWNPPKISGECSIEFEILFYINNELIISNTTKRTYYVVSDGIATCSELKAEIRTISDNGSTSDFTYERTQTAFGNISSITVDKNIASWTMKSDSTKCMFRIEVDGQIVADKINKLSYNMGTLNQCHTYLITVIPINFNGHLGTPYEIKYKPDIGSPYRVQMVQINNNIVITWTPPQNMSRYCIVDYEMTFYVDGDFQMTDVTELSHYTFSQGLEPCSRFRIKIRTISSTGSMSAWVSEELITETGEIGSIMTNDDVVYWSMIAGPTRCKFRVEANEKIVVDGISELSYKLENLPSCKINKISITPINSNASLGTARSISLVKKPDTVQNFRARADPENGTITALWDAINGECSTVITIPEVNVTFITSASAGSFVFHDEGFEYCKPYIMQAHVKSNASDDVTGVSSNSFGIVTAIKEFRVEEDPTGGVTAKWKPLLGECNIEIKIIFEEVEVVSESTTAGKGFLVLENDIFEYCKSYEIKALLSAHYYYWNIYPFHVMDEFSTSSVFQRRLQPIEELHLALVGESVKISWTLIDTDMNPCSFEGEFNYKCYTNFVYGGGYGTASTQSEFIFCEFHKFTATFNLTLTPKLSHASVFEVSSVHCVYTANFYLDRNSGSSSVCPSQIM